jgi:hypothetical protein
MDTIPAAADTLCSASVLICSGLICPDLICPAIFSAPFSANSAYGGVQKVSAGFSHGVA